MSKHLIPALAVIFVLTSVTTAQAGKVRSGQVSPAVRGGLSKAARKLVGTWRIDALEVAATRRPFPGTRAYTVTLRGDGTVSVKNLPTSQAKKFKRARWKVKGKYLLFTVKKKVQKFGYSIKANELAVALPGNIKYRIILVRVAKKPQP